MSGKWISSEDERITAPSPPFIFTQIALNSEEGTCSKAIWFVLPLTAEERTKSRHYFEAQLDSQDGQAQPLDVRVVTGNQGNQHNQNNQHLCGVYLRLPRGTVLQHGDRLTTDTRNAILRIMAKPEPVMTAIAPTPLDLLKAAYHLGNRHVELEVNLNYLRFSPDPVLKRMVERMGLRVTEAVLPFQPEAGAYASHNAHASHRHSHHTH